MPTDVIKEYLIKLGVDISAGEISKFENSLSKIDKGIVNFFKRWNNAFLLFSKQCTRLVSRIVNFNLEIAKNDIYLQRWAKTLYLTVDSARALDRTLSAMGLDVEDLRDVALNPELTKQYKELIQLSNSLNIGEPLERAAKHFREIGFEFQRIKIILEYFKEKILAYTWKFMESSAGKNFAATIRKFSDFGVSIMDKVAEKVGRFFASIITSATRLMEMGQAVYRIFIKPLIQFFDSLGTFGKLITSTFAQVGLAIMAGPFGKVFVVVKAFLDLVDDYLVWKSGGKSSKMLKGFWGAFDDTEAKPGEPKVPGLPTKEEYEQTGLGLVGEFLGHFAELPGKGIYWTSYLLEDLLGLHDQTFPEVEFNPRLLPPNHDEAAQDAARREYIERQSSNQTNNNIPINIYVNGVQDPKAAAEKTVALLRSYKGIYA